MYRFLNHNRMPFMPPYPNKVTHLDREKAFAMRISGKELPKPGDCEGRLAEIVLKACAYDPKDRYSSPDEMRRELEAILYNEAEANIIYPKGDNVDINSLHYVSNSNDEIKISEYVSSSDDETKTIAFVENANNSENNNHVSIKKENIEDFGIKTKKRRNNRRKCCKKFKIR